MGTYSGFKDTKQQNIRRIYWLQKSYTKNYLGHDRVPIRDMNQYEYVKRKLPCYCVRGNVGKSASDKKKKSSNC